jgi:hypothetical protein
MEESQNRIQGFYNGEEERAFFPSRGQGSNTKNLFPEAKKKRSANTCKAEGNHTAQSVWQKGPFGNASVLTTKRERFQTRARAINPS